MSDLVLILIPAVILVIVVIFVAAIKIETGKSKVWIILPVAYILLFPTFVFIGMGVLNRERDANATAAQKWASTNYSVYLTHGEAVALTSGNWMTTVEVAGVLTNVELQEYHGEYMLFTSGAAVPITYGLGKE
jgi:hypothetical protein